MRVAYFSPLPPLRSGIADYSAALLPYLAAHCEVDVFVDSSEKAGETPTLHVAVRDWREFEREHAAGRYDTVLYHIGNNPHHVYIYEMAMRVPGVVMLHEFNLHYLMAELTIRRGDWDGYLRELEYNAGPEALKNADAMRQGKIGPDYNGVAMNRRLLETSRAAIVHSDYMVRLVREAGFTLPLARIPHGVQAPQADPLEMRLRLGLDHEPVAGAFGFLKPYKRIESAIRAMARLSRDFPTAHLLLAGEEHPHYPLRPLIEELCLKDRVHILGFVPLEEFDACIAASDVCLNLRYPTVGESSGSLLRELAAGKPTIVSDLGAFSELPEHACIKIPPGDVEVEWLTEYLAALWNSPELRVALGESARRYAATECSWPKVATQYAAFLREQCGIQLERGATIADYILSFGAHSDTLDSYVRVHLNRLVHTIEITPRGGPGKSVLEMGCYMQLTPSLRRFLDYEEIRGCYYGRAGESSDRTVVSSAGENFTCRIDLFDAEKDTYPYPDASFDTVLCCELVEHLYFDPMHMMGEINRILKPGGHLVLTTPNITAARGLHAILHGYHPGLFHTYVVPKAGGEVDPRHNREYAPRDVRALLEKSGFTVIRLETGWIEEGDAARYAEVDKLLAQTGHSREMRGDLIYSVGQKTGPVQERYPVELYTAF